MTYIHREAIPEEVMDQTLRCLEGSLTDESPDSVSAIVVPKRALRPSGEHDLDLVTFPRKGVPLGKFIVDVQEFYRRFGDRLQSDTGLVPAYFSIQLRQHTDSWILNREFPGEKIVPIHKMLFYDRRDVERDPAGFAEHVRDNSITIYGDTNDVPEIQDYDQGARRFAFMFEATNALCQRDRLPPEVVLADAEKILNYISKHYLPGRDELGPVVGPVNHLGLDNLDETARQILVELDMEGIRSSKN